MDGYVSLLCGGVSAEEPAGAAVFYQVADSPVHNAAALTQRAGGPHPAHEGCCTRPRQPQLQEDEEDTHG